MTVPENISFSERILLQEFHFITYLVSGFINSLVRQSVRQYLVVKCYSEKGKYVPVLKQLIKHSAMKTCGEVEL
jgi:hypothetical protein